MVDLMAEVKEIIEDENKIDTVIADDIDFKGKIVFKNSLKIKGKFQGKIETTGHIIMGQESEISADIITGTITNNGTFNGKIQASKLIELNKKSSTRGDLVTPDIIVEKGAYFSGTCITEKQN